MTNRHRTVQILRRVHRSTGLLLSLLLAGIAFTGTILQTIMVIYGDSGPRQAPGEPFWVVRLRDWAVTVHTWAFVGLVGNYLGIVCALALLFFLFSGIWMYLESYRSRTAEGRKALFWRMRSGKGATMRSLHRWVTLPFAPLAILLAVTGASLAVYFAWEHIVPLPPPRTPRGLGGAPKSGGPPGPPPEGRVWHDLSLSLHKLNFLGWTGHVFGLTMGLALLALAVSGVWMYGSMYRQRLRADLPGLFW